MAFTRLSSRACCSAARKPSTIESLTLPGMEELIRPRIVMTAIFSVVACAPLCSRISRKRGIGSASRIPLTRLNAAIINTKFTNRLAQSAMNKKMLRQLSLRSGVIPNQTAGELPRAQAVFQRRQNRRHAFEPFGGKSIPQVRMSAPFICPSFSKSQANSLQQPRIEVIAELLQAFAARSGLGLTERLTTSLILLYISLPK